MGRYYEGDIEGKFAFAIQSSTAADRFGVEGTTPNYVEYYFDTENLDDIRSELQSIEKTFGKNKNAILSYYDLKPDMSIWDYLSKGGITIPPENVSDFYDYILGRQILECILEKGDCSFTAEL